MSALNQQLAIKFVERAEALALKGKKRDDAALDFFTGAASMYAQEHPEIGVNNNPLLAVVFIVSVRGYMAVKELAEGR